VAKAPDDYDFRDVDEITKTNKGVTFSLPIETRKQINILRREMKLDKPAHVVRAAVEHFSTSKGAPSQPDKLGILEVLGDIAVHDFGSVILDAETLSLVIPNFEIWSELHIHSYALGERFRKKMPTRIFLPEESPDEHVEASLTRSFQRIFRDIDEANIREMVSVEPLPSFIIRAHVSTLLVMDESKVWFMFAGPLSSLGFGAVAAKGAGGPDWYGMLQAQLFGVACAQLDLPGGNLLDSITGESPSN
jgi:hypothetical protein